ncbi:unnamed protein product [Sphagnum troendelagicum]|uniref:BRO1 domain-containing protein n=1 Tax=Sphagnum troendelagicum TaxID=128251 RepID=A0ABP0U904_9BRYO
MGCIQSSDAIEDWESSTYGGGGSAANGEVYVFVPGFRAPKNVELAAHLLLQQQASSSSISPELATRLVYLRSRISHLAAKPDRSSSHKSRHADDEQGVGDLAKALEGYLPLLMGLTTGGEKLSSGFRFEWTNVEDEKKETALSSAYYELLSVLHLLGMLAMQDANLMLTPTLEIDDYKSKIFEGIKRMAIETLLKAVSYFECAISAVIPNAPDDIKAKLPADLMEGMFIALEQQALGQAVELQLGFAVENVTASLAVKRRLACEQVKCWEQAQEKLACMPLAEGWGAKHILFAKWKLAEAKAMAYYFHAQVLEEGFEVDTHAHALACFRESVSYLKEGQRQRVYFNNTYPTSRLLPPIWGPMKHLSERIPREASSKARIFRDSYNEETAPETTPKLPDFPIALTAELYVLPPVDPAWESKCGYEARTSSLTVDVPSLLAKANQDQKLLTSVDLHRQQPVSPPPPLSLVAPEPVQA